MNTNILSRGFTLTAALHSAVLREIDAYCSRHGNSATSIDVRLFDSNGPRGGPDKVCLIRTHLASRRELVAIDVGTDVYVAIEHAFNKLTRATQSANGRRRTLQRSGARRTMSRIPAGVCSS